MTKFFLKVRGGIFWDSAICRTSSFEKRTSAALETPRSEMRYRARDSLLPA